MRLLNGVKLSLALALVAALYARAGAGEKPRGPALAFRVGKVVTMDDEYRVVEGGAVRTGDRVTKA